MGRKRFQFLQQQKQEGQDVPPDSCRQGAGSPFSSLRLLRQAVENDPQHFGRRLLGTRQADIRQLLLCGASDQHIGQLFLGLNIILSHPILVSESQQESWTRLKSNAFYTTMFGNLPFLNLLLNEAPASLVRQLAFLALEGLTETARFLLTPHATLAPGAPAVPVQRYL